MEMEVLDDGVRIYLDGQIIKLPNFTPYKWLGRNFSGGLLQPRLKWTYDKPVTLLKTEESDFVPAYPSKTDKNQFFLISNDRKTHHRICLDYNEQKAIFFRPFRSPSEIEYLSRESSGEKCKKSFNKLYLLFLSKFQVIFF
eukprot:GHVP01035132.1.p1 GENE.GHVP01035132.1~~GHVP01035132.1.p1  ORF type:complete len:164 (+),score=23.68 GHVP01035132.1:72-494(+)